MTLTERVKINNEPLTAPTHKQGFRPSMKIKC